MQFWFPSPQQMFATKATTAADPLCLGLPSSLTKSTWNSLPILDRRPPLFPWKKSFRKSKIWILHIDGVGVGCCCMVNQREQKASYRTQLCIQIPAVVCSEIHAEIGEPTGWIAVCMGIFAFFALQQMAGIWLAVCMLTAFAQQTARARLHGRTVDICSKNSTYTALMQQHQC
jgi:hypothetical protein